MKHYAVFTCAKQTGGAAGGGLSAHIERQTWDAEQHMMVEFRPKSVIHPKRTRLNKEYILPEGTSRGEAIEARIRKAGVTRKIKDSQVRALCFLCSSDKVAMDRIVAEGRFDDYAQACIDFLRQEVGKENVVSACAHFDETTAHLHVTVVPIVSGAAAERPDTKRQHEARNGKAKRRYKKQEVTARLCAKEVFTPENSERWQEEFPKFLQSRGFDLQRGEKGSKAKHMDPKVYNAIKAETEQLQQERLVAEQELASKKQELVTAEGDLKSAKSGLLARIVNPSKHKEMLAAERKAGADEALDTIITNTHLTFKQKPTAEQFGKKYRGLWDDKRKLTKDLTDERNLRAQEKVAHDQENVKHATEVANLQADLDAAKADVKHWQNENTDLTNEYFALASERNELRDRLAALDDSHLSELETALADTKAQLAAANATINNVNIFLRNLYNLTCITIRDISFAVSKINEAFVDNPMENKTNAPVNTPVNTPARAAFALFLGYVDVATTYLESSVGGGGVQGQITDWQGRHLDESSDDYLTRCITAVKSAIAPKPTLSRSAPAQSTGIKRKGR